MAGKIKGITIEIGGNTQPLQKALGDVNSKSQKLQSELKEVNRLLKLDPHNTELLGQKQKILADSIGNTSEKLEKLKEVQSQVNDQFARGDISEEQYREFRREIEKTEHDLKSMNDTVKETNKRTNKLADDLEKTGKKLKTYGSKVTDVGKNITMGVTAPIVGLGVASANAAMNFEAQMSRVQAISGATTGDLQKLNEQALDLGASTSFSATGVAEGMENLASAGFTVEEIMSAMPGLLDLAASSGEDLASSSDIAASTLRGFGLDASEAGHVADVLAKNASATNAAVADTGEAMKYIAPVANAMGLSLEEITAAIGEMANAGIKGSQAGTTLRGALTRLAKPTDKAAAAMDDIGFKAFDSQGKMKSLQTIIGDLNKSMSGMTDQQKQQTVATIFGQEAMSGLLTLMSAGPESLGKLTESYKNSTGAASEMADTMLNNTKGSIEEMKGSLETAGIKIGQALSPAITSVAKVIGKLADAFSNLPKGVQEGIIAFLAIIATIGPLIMLIGGIITGIGSIMTIMPLLGGAFAVLTGPIGLTVAAIAGLITGGVLLVKNWDSIKAGASALGKNLGKAFGNIAKSIGKGLTGAKDAVKRAVAHMKDTLNFKWKLPKLKMPHFSASGKFSLDPPSIPKFSVKWFKTGAIFDSPNIIGVGESGREAVLPIEKLDSIIASALKKLGGSDKSINYYITINNPKQETSADSVRKTLLKQSYGI